MTFHFFALSAAAVTAMYFLVVLVGDWALFVLFPVMIKVSAVLVLGALDKRRPERTAEMGRRDRRAGLIFVAFIGGLVALTLVFSAMHGLTG